MAMPDFIIIGAAKAGTTALYEILRQHPQIGMSSIKEPNFFALEGEILNYAPGTTSEGYLEECITDLECYQNQFGVYKRGIVLGEASPLYLYAPKASERIRHHLPNAKIIAILRDPVARAYSNYLHHVREGIESVSSFEEALELEERRQKDNWWWGFSYVKAGFYYTQLKRYTEKFSNQQIRVFLYEDFLEDPARVVCNIFNFLDVDSAFRPDLSERHNVSGVPQNRVMWQFLTQSHPLKEPFKRLIRPELRKLINQRAKNRLLQKPGLSPATRTRLVTILQPEIVKLQDMLQRDLSHWLKV